VRGGGRSPRELAIERAKQVFGAAHANVQPHSGASANIAAYFATVSPGEKVLAMSLPHGGHLTHGMPINFSGKWFDVVPYGLDEDTETIDMDEVRRSRSSTGRSSSSPAGPRTRSSSTSRRSAPSPTRSARC
jgi:glycine/serine hydroxymethyltransferase